MSQVSIIIPVYKVEPYLNKCVDSVLAQTFSDFEVILVDDGSPDRCGAICDEYANRDERIRVIHQENRGLSAARNVGIDIASSEWITFLDSDDWVNETYLERLLASVSGGITAAISVMHITDGSRVLSRVGDKLKDKATPEEVYSRENLMAIWACGKLLRRDLIGDLRFPVGIIQEDEFFTYQVLFKSPEVAVVKGAEYNYLRRPDSIVGGKWHPERLAAIEGMKDQLRYFELNGFRLAMTHVRRRLLSWLVDAVNSLRRDWPFEKEILDCTRKELLACAEAWKELLMEDARLAYSIRLACFPEWSFIIKGWYFFVLVRRSGFKSALAHLRR